MPQIVLRSASDIDLKRTLSPQFWAASSVAALEQRDATRRVIYLLGTRDTNPDHPALDKTCLMVNGTSSRTKIPAKVGLAKQNAIFRFFVSRRVE
jgi:hypothetical protein